MESLLILIDRDENVLGYGEKMSVHKEGLLHKAFSVFVADDYDRILLQKRALCKYHSGGKWSNTCCSHLYKDEDYGTAIRRTFLDELGILIPDLRIDSFSEGGRLDVGIPLYIDRFYYFSQYDGLSEHEIDHVFLYKPDSRLFSALTPNPQEVSELRWFSMADIESMLAKRPADFSSWFPQAFRIAMKGF